MPDSAPRSRRIRILRDEVSRKIAAGEVIDRPFSIVRELLDNAIDAGAHAIDVHLEAGGLCRVRVVDDGAGMGEEDLALCWQPHATSKIETEDDLLARVQPRVPGRGAFQHRGVQPAGHGQLQRGPASPRTAWRCAEGRLVALEKLPGPDGNRGRGLGAVLQLPGAEEVPAQRVRRVGALPVHLHRQGGGASRDRVPALLRREVRLSLRPGVPAGADRARVRPVSRSAAAPGEPRRKGTASPCGSWRAAPDVRRRDRKLLQCFVNGRRVSEFSLLQAAEYGFAGYMPGGWHPAAFIFVEIDPELVDFNIHPAKKEVRFRNLPEVHKAVVARCRRSLVAAGAAPLVVDPVELQGGGLPQSAPDGAGLLTLLHRADLAARLSRPVAAGASPPTSRASGSSARSSASSSSSSFPGGCSCWTSTRPTSGSSSSASSRGRRHCRRCSFPSCFDVSEDEEERLLEAPGRAGGHGDRRAARRRRALRGDGTRRGL